MIIISLQNYVFEVHLVFLDLVLTFNIESKETKNEKNARKS